MTSKNCVLVSTGRSKLHLYYAAAAAQKANLLHCMVTTIYLKKRWLSLIRLLIKLTNKTFFKKLFLCRDNQINDKKVISLPSITILSKTRTLISQRGISSEFRFWLERIESIYYGKRIKRYINPEVKLIHSRSGYSREVIPYARKKGIKVLLEQSASHPKFANSILKDEYDKWDIPKKYRSYVEPENEMKWDLEQADYILTNSDFCASTIAPYVPNPENVKVVYTGVDTELFKPLNNKKKDQFTILTVGTVTINKGILYLLRAFKKLRLSDARLIVVGKKCSDLPKEFEEYHDLYDYIPFVPNNELPELMNNSNLFVLASLAEGSARVVGEAMACGLPCVVTPNCGSTISDGIDGFLVPTQNEDAIAEKILELYQSRELCLQTGSKAREKVVNSLTWKHYQENLINIYKEIINDNE